MADIVFTVGHSNHSTERFIELLASHGVTVVADVRSRPYSRYNPQFNRETLVTNLKATGISYVFLGRELGARTEDRNCYVEGKVQYDLIARTSVFQEGIIRLIKGVRMHRIAMMCAEKDPLTCHRAILVCRHLAVRGIGAEHILEHGQLESHENALKRLLSEHGMIDRDLFLSRDELIADAYSRRGHRIAYGEEGRESEEIVRGARR